MMVAGQSRMPVGTEWVVCDRHDGMLDSQIFDRPLLAM